MAGFKLDKASGVPAIFVALLGWKSAPTAVFGSIGFSKLSKSPKSMQGAVGVVQCEVTVLPPVELQTHIKSTNVP